MSLKISKRLYLVLGLLTICFILLLNIVIGFYSSLERLRTTSDFIFIIVNIGNFTPILFICIYLIREIIQINQKKITYVEKVNDFILFCPRFHIYFCVFAYNSLEIFSWDSLNQLIDLKTFSIEVDYENRKIRVFMFSKSKTDLFLNIQNVKPLLEAIFPNIQIVSSSNIENQYVNYSIERFGDYALLQVKSKFIQPQILSYPYNEYKQKNSIIISCIIDREDEGKLFQEHTTQVYTLSYRKNAIFSFFGRLFSSNQGEQTLLNENILYRTLIRIQLDKSNLVTFEQGLSYLKRNSIKSTKTEKMKSSYQDQQHPPFEQVQREHIIPKPSFLNNQSNQICIEFCNIIKDSNLNEKRKIDLCSKRTDFCQKLLNNPNFSKSFSELENNNSPKRKIKILTEIKQYLSDHQFYCLSAHFLDFQFTRNIEFDAMGLLHALISVNINLNLKQISEKKTVSPHTNNIVKGLTSEKLLNS